MSRRVKKMDVVFVIDATGSMASAIAAARDKACDLAFDLHIHEREADFAWGCVCYRDPVDSPTDAHQVFDLTKDAEALTTWLEDIRATGGGDGFEDFVGAIQMALTRISWRGGKRALIWIADAPAHGRRWCGTENHQEEEGKLEPLVRRLAQEEFYMVGLSLNGGADRTFSEMKAIFEACRGKPFNTESFSPEQGNEIGAIAATMMASTTSVVHGALAGITA
jgi:hypothetical protein